MRRTLSIASLRLIASTLAAVALSGGARLRESMSPSAEERYRELGKRRETPRKSTLPRGAGSPRAEDLSLDAGLRLSGEPPARSGAISADGGSLLLADGAPGRSSGAMARFARVRFGVILVTYQGAEEGPEKGGRSKAEALVLATQLAEQGKSDFQGAVRRGDTGSSDDVGEVGRGVLEPTSEGALFGLPVDGVSDVVETPRGYWIVKRLE